VWCIPEAVVPVALVGGGAAVVVARRGREASIARAAGRPRLCDLERAAARRAWQDQQLSAVTQRRLQPCARRRQVSG
jgi:hypothetical protein